MPRFEVTARWAHGSVSTVVSAATAEAVIRLARPKLRRMVPLAGYALGEAWAVLAD